MNKYQKALETIVLNHCTKGYKCETCTQEIECEKFIGEIVCQNKKSYQLLQELVEKACPKKPIKDYYTKHPNIEFNWKCPNCGNGLLLWFDEEPNKSDEYCGCCGQHIDWSENE